MSILAMSLATVDRTCSSGDISTIAVLSNTDSLKMGRIDTAAIVTDGMIDLKPMRNRTDEKSVSGAVCCGFIP